MQKIIPFLWFDGKAEEAANFYTSIFKNSKIVNIMRYGEADPGPKER
jgi:predicted 3-demethylubiquinone-9 3-methyltransferase (glyoxalase superfamily)